MKKLLIILLNILLLTGCKLKFNNSDNNNTIKEQTIVNNQKYEGLEFVNLSIKDGIVKTAIINNTEFIYVSFKFKMKIMDENDNVLIETVEENNMPLEAGIVRQIETKTKTNLNRASSIEYSIVEE